MPKKQQPRLPSRAKGTAQKRAFGQSGTALAIKDKKQGCGLIPTRVGWGGARNRADRSSQHLSLSQCRAMLAAAQHAADIGRRFNRHWIIHYQRAGIAEHDAARFVGRLLKLAGDYARRGKGKMTAIWVRENGEGKGGHVHILLHLPSHLSTVGKTRRWVGLAGGRCHAGVSHMRAIAGRVKAADSPSAHYQRNVEAVRDYLMKGASREAGIALGLARFDHAGLIIGKRCGWTQDIGQAARGGI